MVFIDFDILIFEKTYTFQNIDIGCGWVYACIWQIVIKI